MATDSVRHRLGIVSRLLFFAATTGLVVSVSHAALGQEKKAAGKEDSVFDEDKNAAAGAQKKAADTKGAKMSPTATRSASASKTPRPR